MCIEPLSTHISQFFSSPSDLMKSTVVDESLFSTDVLFQRESTYYLILQQNEKSTQNLKTLYLQHILSNKDEQIFYADTDIYHTLNYILYASKYPVICILRCI